MMEMTNNRKSMQKLLLINWSRFQVEKICIEGSVLFNGVNGSGKSTVLDAITYLMTGNTEFNVAAKDRDRTVRSYVRGDTKSNERQYLREGNVLSYIVAEFYDPVKEAPLVVGVAMESRDISTCKSFWFIVPEEGIDDISFYRELGDEIEIIPKKDLTVKGRRLGAEIFIGNKKQAIDQVLRTLGVKYSSAELYRKKVLSMMKFDPEGNIDKFISECILQPTSIKSLDQLREQKKLFEDAKAMYQNEIDSRNMLTALDEIAKRFESKQQRYLTNDMIFYLQKVKEHEGRLKYLDSSLNKLDKKLRDLNIQREDVVKEEESARERLDAIIHTKEFEEYDKTVRTFQSQRDQLSQKLPDYEREIDDLKKAENIICSDLRWVIEDNYDKSMYHEELHDLSFDEDVYTSLSKSKHESEQKLEAFTKLNHNCKIISDENNKAFIMYNLKNDELKKNLQKEQEVLSDLKANIRYLPNGVRKAKEIIIKELEKVGVKTEVKTFSELVTGFKNEDWRLAIETFLGRRRYNLFVDEKYCQEVVRIIETKNLNDISVVYTDKITDVSEDPKPGSAAIQLEISNKAARCYANYLLNGIHLCDNLDELHAHPLGGITTSGMLARGYSVSRLNMKDTMITMGLDAIKFQIESVQGSIELIMDEINENEQKMDEINEVLRNVEKLRYGAEYYNFYAPQRYDECITRINELTESIENIKQSSDMVAILEEQSRAKDFVDQIRSKVREIDNEIGSVKGEINHCSNEKVREEKDLEIAKENYKEKKFENPNITYLAEEEYEKLSKKLSKTIVISDGSLRNLWNELEKIERELISQQIDYCRLRGKDISKQGSGYIPWYRAEYAEVSNVKLEEAKNKMEEKGHELQMSFMHDFIGEINEAIVMAKKEVEILNKELKKLPFGQDTYSFEVKDKPERNQFFRIARKITSHGTPEFYMALNSVDEEMEDDIQEFMSIILNEENDEEYTDYRKYLVFDMKITRVVNGAIQTTYLSKKQGSASRGEKETPYLIILAAALMQFYPKDRCCSRLAFIDEAFAALSRERIDQMVKYFDGHNFQVIYAAPSEKIQSIGKLVDTTVTIEPEDEYSHFLEGLRDAKI